MKYTQIPTDTFATLQLNAGIVASDFTPSTGAVAASDIIGATTGGVSIEITPSFSDFGEDIDNCPKNTKELKHIDSWDIKMSGTILTLDTATVKSLIGAADIDAIDTTKVTPRIDLAAGDFADIWWIGDYSDKNGATNGGFVAVHLLNALSTGGFKIQSGDKAKGQFAFEYTAHYSVSAPDVVPFVAYVKAGSAEPTQ